MNYGHRRSWAGLVALVVVTALLSSAATALLLTHSGSWTPGLPGGAAPFAVLEQVRGELQAYFAYPERATDEQLERAAIEGMIEALDDPYTAYFDPGEYAALLADMDETYSGVGIRVEWTEEGLVTVVSPIPGSPGEAAGLRPGDQIVAIDGDSLAGLAFEQVVARIKGPAGTPVTLTIQREGDRFDATVERATIDVPTVEWAMVAPDIGYVRLWEFNKGLASRLETAVGELRDEGASGLVIDLRQNPGGLMDEAIKVADFLLPAGDIIRYEPRFAEPHTYKAKGKGLDLPYVLLVDQFSASASEIVAGAVKDRGDAPLVGTRTFGKGIIQSIIELDNGGGLKVTSARYLTPSGADIHGVGIEPNLVVEAAADEAHGPAAARDPLQNRQMAEAVRELRAEMARQGARAGTGR